VYIGNDLSASQPQPYRNTAGLIEIFRENEVGNLTVLGDKQLPTNPPIASPGFLRHEEMLQQLTMHHIGLLPWKKHWLHKFKDPNKPYEYAHAGLLTLSTSDMTSVLNNLGDFVKPFDDYEGLLDLLTYYRNHLEELLEMKPRIRGYALQNLTWEEHGQKILEAYSEC
jgi:hypothetical protein